MMKRFAIAAITVLIFLASYLAGHKYNNSVDAFYLLDQTCWVGFSLIICLLLHDLKGYAILFWVWVVLLGMSIFELVDEYQHLNTQIRGADYINLGMALVTLAYLIHRYVLRKK